VRSPDARLRELERALDTHPGDDELRQRYLYELLRAGYRDRVCELLSLRWEASAEHAHGLHPNLAWEGVRLGLDGIRDLVADDLRNLDLVLLAANFPRLKNGGYRLNCTRFLRRYPAHDTDGKHRRLWLLAWTPGTAMLWERPEDRGKRVMTLALETRSTHGTRLPLSAWRGDSEQT
jgi:hypothetical protein